jgi:hypothetical protein
LQLATCDAPAACPINGCAAPPAARASLEFLH